MTASICTYISNCAATKRIRSARWMSKTDMEASVSVNGREVSPMVGSIVAEGAGVTRCAGVYKCDAAQVADVLIDVGNDKSGATFAKRVQTGTSIQRCRVYQSADGGMPEPIESFGLIGDKFKMVQVKYAAGSNLGDAECWKWRATTRS